MLQRFNLIIILCSVRLQQVAVWISLMERFKLIFFRFTSCSSLSWSLIQDLATFLWNILSVLLLLCLRILLSILLIQLILRIIQNLNLVVHVDHNIAIVFSTILNVGVLVSLCSLRWLLVLQLLWRETFLRFVLWQCFTVAFWWWNDFLFFCFNHLRRFLLFWFYVKAVRQEL